MKDSRRVFRLTSVIPLDQVESNNSSSFLEFAFFFKKLVKIL